MSELLRDIIEVSAFISGDEEEPLLIVEVEALSASAGWVNIRLDPHIYITPPEDGVQDFDLVGDRPAGNETATTLGDTDPAAIEAEWEGPLDDWVVGVRIHAVNNMIEDEIFDSWIEDEEDVEAA
ncbi:hypothetical protein [Sphingopyxis sp. MWB1]|uniref:hypothetical protein n=1 Tax=Sphingopyxis sp. MWB1 TaxID=1537715 RepID=UPI00051A43B4|nr:hypothetical protein [Sphingopyxis sp. MWB1]